MQNIEELVTTPLSDADIRNYLGGHTLVMKYNELDQYPDIDALLQPYNNAIILLEVKESFGHWVCIKRTGDVISFFDSYGGFPDSQKRYVSKKFLEESGQKYNKICELLDQASYQYTVEFSDYGLQDISNHELATCGHWCCVFVKSGLTVEPFYEYIKSFDYPDLDQLVVLIYYNMPPNKKMKCETY